MTDTNQASEDERTKLALILGYERQEQHSSEKTRWYDLDEYGNPIEVTKKVDKVIDLIRTEKLKLLAEVREQAIEQYARNKQVDPFDFVWPCEPDCSKERHAYHQGQWDIANRIEKQLKTEETHTSKKCPVCNKSTGGMIVVYNHGELLHEKCYEQLKTEGDE